MTTMLQAIQKGSFEEVTMTSISVAGPNVKNAEKLKRGEYLHECNNYF